MGKEPDHWAHRGNLAWIDAQLRSRGLDPARPTVEALAIHDQLHSGGLEATRSFLRWVAPCAGAQVLDLGAGLGGTARLLARDHGCRVTALERSAPLRDAAIALSARFDLDPPVEHVLGDATRFRSGEGFDLVMIQHVDMHIENKSALYRTCAENLGPRGRLVWHDWLAGPGGSPRYPVPWSSEGEGSFLTQEACLRDALDSVGLRMVTVLDLTGETTGWYRFSIAKLRAALDRPIPTDPALRERRAELERLLIASENVLASIEERCLIPFFGEAVDARSSRV